MATNEFSCVLFPAFIAFVALQNVLSLTVENNPYWHIANLDTEGHYVLEWDVNWTNRTVTFNVTVATTGYIGFGLSRKGNKRNSDYVIGGVDTNGGAYFFDLHGVFENKLTKDKSQDYILNNSWENRTHTSLQFTRFFESCDDYGEDFPINDNTIVLLWGIGENGSDDVSKAKYQFNYEGTFQVHLLDPDFTPKTFKHVSRDKRVANSDELGDDLKVWTVTRKQKVAVKETVYWCSLHKGPELQKRHHLVGFNFRRENEIEFDRTHHMSLLRCQAPDGEDPVNVFEPFVQDGTGEMCYFFLRGEAGGLPLQYCRETVFAYAIGGRMHFLPDHVGLPFGDNPHEYYALQVHYDNRDLRTDLEYTINIDLYYTENLRQHDVGVATTGYHIPGSPGILIPPNTKEHIIYGHCGSGCTSQMLPPEGINIVSVLQHTHLSGRRHRLQQFQNGVELPWIINDDNYDGNYQAMRMLREEAKVMPGDHLVTRCVFDSTWINGSSVLGGFGIRQEMCLEYIWYYNKMKEHVLCRSEIFELEEYTEKHLGVLNYTWNDDLVDYVATQPKIMNGLTLNQIADNEIEWSFASRKKLQWDQMTLSQRVSCPSFSQLQNGNNGEGEGSDVVEYPVEVEEYVPENFDSCS